MKTCERCGARMGFDPQSGPYCTSYCWTKPTAEVQMMEGRLMLKVASVVLGAMAVMLSILVYQEVTGRDCLRYKRVEGDRYSLLLGNYVGVETHCVAWEPR